MATLGKSRSLPSLMTLGLTVPKGRHHHRKSTLSYSEHGPVDLKHWAPPSEEAVGLASRLKSPGWRLTASERPPARAPTLEELVPRNMRHPRLTPAWLKHEKQVLRFYAFFQEGVAERPDENSRYRNVNVMFFMEDGTMSIVEPKVENSGLAQGAFLKRHHAPREDGTGNIGPDDLRCGIDITVYTRTYHITGCDRFTRWFYEENGIDVGEDEPMIQDLWHKSYKFKKTTEKGGMPPLRSAAEAKHQAMCLSGSPPCGDKKMKQFLLNDRKVLRFKGYWDDTTPYGARTYFVIHYYLASNQCEINEAHCRNSGRDNYPAFMKKGPLYKTNATSVYPGMLAPDADVYMPEDFIVGGSINVWGRRVVIYDCDDFTQRFYKEYLGIDQKAGAIDISEKPIRHLTLAPPPHNGIGTEEDSLINCQMIVPKPPKQDLVKLMTLGGENLRFEAKVANGEPEDESRRLVIGFMPDRELTAVYEVPIRNSGHMAGKFREKCRLKNPDTGAYFKLEDLYIGKTVTICSQPLHIIRADEHCLRYLEARPEQFPHADPVACARKLAPLAGELELQDPNGVEPDRLKALAADAGVELVDHEIITLLRRFGMDGADGPRICAPRVLEAAGGGRPRGAAGGPAAAITGGAAPRI